MHLYISLVQHEKKTLKTAKTIINCLKLEIKAKNNIKPNIRNENAHTKKKNWQKKKMFMCSAADVPMFG